MEFERRHGNMKLARSMEKNLSNYSEICEIGALVEMKWTADDLAGTEWKAGKLTDKPEASLLFLPPRLSVCLSHIYERGWKLVLNLVKVKCSILQGVSKKGLQLENIS